MKKEKWILPVCLLSLAMSLVGAFLLWDTHSKQIRYGFVNTPALLQTFSLSADVQKQLQEEQKKMEKDMRLLGDSLRAFEERLQQEYASAVQDRKLALRREHAGRLEDMKRFEDVQFRKIRQLEAEKMGPVYDKINAAIKEFAVANGYDLIFGTADGNILYGDGTSADLTVAFSEFLNARFR